MEGLRIPCARCPGSGGRRINCGPPVFSFSRAGHGVPESRCRIVPLHRNLRPFSRLLAERTPSHNTLGRTRRLSVGLVSHKSARLIGIERIRYSKKRTNVPAGLATGKCQRLEPGGMRDFLTLCFCCFSTSSSISSLLSSRLRSREPRSPMGCVSFSFTTHWLRWSPWR